MEKAALEGQYVIIEHLIVGGAEGGAGMLHKITKPTASRGVSEVLEDVCSTMRISSQEVLEKRTEQAHQ